MLTPSIVKSSLTPQNCIRCSKKKKGAWDKQRRTSSISDVPESRHFGERWNTGCVTKAVLLLQREGMGFVACRVSQPSQLPTQCLLRKPNEESTQNEFGGVEMENLSVGDKGPSLERDAAGWKSSNDYRNRNDDYKFFIKNTTTPNPSLETPVIWIVCVSKRSLWCQCKSTQRCVCGKLQRANRSQATRTRERIYIHRPFKKVLYKGLFGTMKLVATLHRTATSSLWWCHTVFASGVKTRQISCF